MRRLYVPVVLVFFFTLAAAQPQNSGKIFGLRVYGEKEGDLPIARIDGQPITIEFDVNDTLPADFRLKIYHCDKNWQITRNSFVNDELRSTMKLPVPFEPAPKFVRHYTYHYTARIPGFSGIKKFPQSGNYVFQLWDKDDQELFSTGRFFVVEQVVLPSMKVRNRYLPSGIAPWNQVNTIEVSLAILQQEVDGEVLYPVLMKTVDIYKNRQLAIPYRVSADDDSPNTFVDGYGLNKVKFVIDNVTPGNEYRRLDLRNIERYPPEKDARPFEGADVTRFLHQGAKDANGASSLVSGDRYADYLHFQFELLRESDDLDSVFVVGDFNEWNPAPSWRMVFDAETKRYKLGAWLRRGVYDYQYVTAGNDWIALEGNDWRTVNLYTAFVYYSDPRFGGFDRILGYVQGLGPGGVQATSN